MCLICCLTYPKEGVYVLFMFAFLATPILATRKKIAPKHRRVHNSTHDDKLLMDRLIEFVNSILLEDKNHRVSFPVFNVFIQS